MSIKSSAILTCDALHLHTYHSNRVHIERYYHWNELVSTIVIQHRFHRYRSHGNCLAVMEHLIFYCCKIHRIAVDCHRYSNVCVGSFMVFELAHVFELLLFFCVCLYYIWIQFSPVNRAHIAHTLSSSSIQSQAQWASYYRSYCHWKVDHWIATFRILCPIIVCRRAGSMWIWNRVIFSLMSFKLLGTCTMCT